MNSLLKQAIVAVALLVSAATLVAMDSDADQALINAVEQGQSDRIPQLLERGANPNLRVIHVAPPQGQMPVQVVAQNTILGIAAVHGNLDVVQALVEGGANVNHLSYSKQGKVHATALDFAEGFEHQHIIKYLRDHGANTAGEMGFNTEQ